MPDLPPPAGKPRVTLSVVSHGHGTQVLDMLHSFASSGLAQWWSVDVVVTLNIPEPPLEAALQPHQTQPESQASARTAWPFPVRLIKNSHPLGFGANHNQALCTSDAHWFCIVNPDIVWPVQLPEAIRAQVQQALQVPVGDPGAGVHSVRQASVAPIGLRCPVQVSPDGRLQDYARHLPLPWVLVHRMFCRLRGRSASSQGVAPDVGRADWVNGACMLVLAPAFRQLGGFDTRYFMYGEDVDLCMRLQLQGYAMAPLPFEIVHHAQRNTAQQWRHLAWHIRSLLRLWSSATFWRYARLRRNLRKM